MADLEKLSDTELIEQIRAHGGKAAGVYFDTLYLRYKDKVARWCLGICHDREEAADLAQEVFMRVHQHLDTFRNESQFSTWLYTVARRTAISHGIARNKRNARLVSEDNAPEAMDLSGDSEGQLSREQVMTKLRSCMERDLKPMEARVVYLHYVDGLSLPAITRLMEFDNKSGAKAYLVGGMRKLRQHFGPWLARQTG